MTETATKEKPILFSGAMVQAILDGRKTMTRRVVKEKVPTIGPIGRSHYEPYWPGIGFNDDGRGDNNFIVCRYGKPGDRFWVRETHAIVPATAYRMSLEEDGSLVPHQISPDGHEWVVYRADWTRSAPTWKPSIHMPRWASRITLEITEIRVERLNDISEEDARAEGYVAEYGYGLTAGCLSKAEAQMVESNSNIRWFANLWNSINGLGSWAADPWVWVIGFKRVENA